MLHLVALLGIFCYGSILAVNLENHTVHLEWINNDQVTVKGDSIGDLHFQTKRNRRPGSCRFVGIDRNGQDNLLNLADCPEEVDGNTTVP